MVTDDDAYDVLRQHLGNPTADPPYRTVRHEAAIAKLVDRGASEAEARELALSALRAAGGHVETVDLGRGDTDELWLLPVPDEWQ